MNRICKRITALFLILLMTASLLASCSGKTGEPPTEEEVFAALSQASNEAINAMNADDKLGLRHGYFFNETCSATVLDGELTQDDDGVSHYTTTVESKNAWKYVDVVETEPPRPTRKMRIFCEKSRFRIAICQGFCYNG